MMPRASFSRKLVEKVLQVDLGQRTYPIYLGSGLLGQPDLFRKHIQCKKVLLVTDTVVAPLYLRTVCNALQAADVAVSCFVLEDGEEHKDMVSVTKIIDQAVADKLDRSSMMVALGGGVVGDITGLPCSAAFLFANLHTGFAASIYQRGIPFIQIPTTLLAMVDSSVGGKTAVNHASGKNLIGSFHQPRAVFMDTFTLSSLDSRQMASGLAEVIKIAFLDEGFWTWLEDIFSTRRVDAYLLEIISRSVSAKASIVAADEREEGQRALLNLGHTFGHAIETGCGYGKWLHGEAVAVGMVMAAELSAAMGMCGQEVVDRVKTLLRAAGLPVCLHDGNTIACSGLSAVRFVEIMSGDKKVTNGRLRLVLVQGIGKAVVTDQYDLSKLMDVVEKFCNV